MNGSVGRAGAMLALGATLALSGCGDAHHSRPQLGIDISTLDNPFFIALRDGAQKEAAAKGADLSVADATNDDTNQANEMEAFVTERLDGIIVDPTDSDTVTPSVRDANKAHIPVVAVDRKSNGGIIGSLIASDNVKAGQLAAEELLKAVPKGAHLAMLIGVPGSSAARDRGKGFTSALSDSSKNTKGAQLVTSQVANFQSDIALNTTINILLSHPEVTGIFAQNDDMALGAVKAIDARGLTGKVAVVGIDGLPGARKAVAAGTLFADIAQQPEVMGARAVDAALELGRGHKPPADQVIALQVVESPKAKGSG